MKTARRKHHYWWWLLAILLVGLLLRVVGVGSSASPANTNQPGPSSVTKPVNTKSASPSSASKPASTAANVTPPADAADALKSLSTIPVTADGSLAGYSRNLFHLWADTDHNGCDARNDVLRRDLINPVAKDGTHDCVIMSGTLVDPYSGLTVVFDKGQASQVPIDHVVPLALAWQHGASLWDDATRTAFGNDLAELQTTTVTMNSSKGDKGPSQWLPPNQAYQCTYAVRFVEILVQWNLTVSSADKKALNNVLTHC
ncbi:MAG: HNH endonuclease family protein [Propionibacteriaceae bacterium]|nr:HNH endonuclease family protein [Propionibacteriaceae bacterium]